MARLAKQRAMTQPKLDLLSVLVVEDSGFIRSVLTATLRAIGIGRVEGVASGADAIR